jgi:hypothetical protein
MSVKTIQYSIQNPCDKSWNEMTPESTGRFCGSCEKSVVDFTGMSDFSIVNYLENHKNEKVCGRFTKPQLDRVYQLNQPVFAPTFDLRAVVLGLALTTFSAIHGFGQTEPQEPVKIDSLINIPPTVVGTVARVHFEHEKESKVSGIIKTSKKDFDQISVELKNSGGRTLKTVHPDSKGKFSMDLNWKLEPYYIEISVTGYETQALYFASVRSLSNLQIELLEQVEMIRGEIIQGDVKVEEDQILQKIEIGNVSIKKTEQ